ncbi:MAG TPA: hypothetical protein VFY64_11790 [Nitrososphaeraceae archaeon]|nr:hypothetical protein [Nitrososphaeraceae archaeon]
MGIVTWIIVIIVFLAILGLGWDTFFSGVKKGADRVGIGPILETAINTTTGLVKNASQEITGSSSNLLSLERAEGQQLQQPQRRPFISSSLNEEIGYLDYRAAAFIKELENLINNFEYTFDLEGRQIFPTNNIKQDIISEYKSSEYNIDDLNYELMGFKIIASDIKIRVDPEKIDDSKTRVDIPLILAEDVKVSNGPINLSYKEVNLGSVYGIYDKTTDKMTVHVPVSVAAKYIQQ